MLGTRRGYGSSVVGWLVLRVGAARLRAAALVVVAAALFLLSGASATPSPTSVTIAGSLQSEAGCAGDWDPACATTHLTYDAGDDVWQGTFTLPGRRLRVQGRAQQRVGRELRPACRAGGANIPLAAPGGAGQVLLRPQDPLGHRQQELGDRGRAGQLPVGARLPRRLDARLPALVARGSRRRRHLHLRDDRAAGRVVRDQGRDQRGLGRELRRGRRARRRATSRSPFRPTARRSRSRTSPRRTC